MNDLIQSPTGSPWKVLIAISYEVLDVVMPSGCLGVSLCIFAATPNVSAFLAPSVIAGLSGLTWGFSGSSDSSREPLCGLLHLLPAPTHLLVSTDCNVWGSPRNVVSVLRALS